ncbi:MAG: SDR family oxidoreductase [Balneolales bacterium]
MTDQKCALITGASSGIGKELTYQFARDGYSLILNALNKTKLEGFGMQVREEYKVPVETISVDLFQMQGADELYNEVRNRNLSVDVLVNNAGVGMYGDFADVDMEEYMKIINLNIISFTKIAKLFTPEIIERKGKILNTASVASYQPGPHMSVYYASKAYDLSMSLSLAEELKPHGVTVTAICPGPTLTNFAKRAKQENTRAFRNKMLTMEAKSVAEEGYQAFKKGKRVAIAGAKNKVSMQMERLLSQKVLTKFSELYLTETIDPDKEKLLHEKVDEHLEQMGQKKQPVKQEQVGPQGQISETHEGEGAREEEQITETFKHSDPSLSGDRKPGPIDEERIREKVKEEKKELR